MSVRIRTLGLAASLLSTAALAGCVGDVESPAQPPPPPDGSTAAAINDYIQGLSGLPVDAPAVHEGERSAPNREGDYSCTVQDLSETRQYDKVVAYSANSDSLWSGSLLRGDSVYSGLFTQTVFDRKPMAISVSLENIAGGKSAVMESPSLSSFRDTLSSILDSEITGATPANIYSEIEQVHTQEQLTLALGAEVSGLGSSFGISSSFNWNDETVHSRYLVRYTQSYYTVDVDAPSNASAVFGDGVTLQEVQDKFGDGNPPLYVSSITYGRMVVFTFESDYSAQELGAALEFVYSGGVDVSGNVSVTYKDIVSSSKITAYILGGSGGEAARTIDSYEALMDFIKEGGNYTKDSPGAPIAYKLNYLRDNEPARLSYTTDYQVKDCARVSQKVATRLVNITVERAGGDPNANLELFGQIWVEAENGVTLFDKDSDNYVTLGDGETWPADGSYISEGVIDVVPQSGQIITVGADLQDEDLVGHSELGFEIVENPFETGWRKDVQVILTGDDTRIVVTVSLQPI
jgi:thiol-activated cytolysin